jgi:hypothetical protein
MLPEKEEEGQPERNNRDATETQWGTVMNAKVGRAWECSVVHRRAEQSTVTPADQQGRYIQPVKVLESSLPLAAVLGAEIDHWGPANQSQIAIYFSSALTVQQM